MDRNFKVSLKEVLKHEGGWSDHPSDPGGATMKGVTIATFRAFVNPKGTKDDLRKITDAQLETVYRRQYWDKVHGAELPDGVDFVTFDYSVHSGPTRAVKDLQKVVGVSQDGKIGPKTLEAIKSMGSRNVINKLCDTRLAFLKRLKTWPTFGKGWSRRVAGVRDFALGLSSNPTPERPAVITKEVEKPIVPSSVDSQVKKKFSLAGWLGTIFSSGGIGALGLAGFGWRELIALGAVAVAVLLGGLALRGWIVKAIKDIRKELDDA